MQDLIQQAKALGLTQSAIAKALGVSSPSVSLWAKGTVTPRQDKVDAMLAFLATQHPASTQDTPAEAAPGTDPYLEPGVVQADDHADAVDGHANDDWLPDLPEPTGLVVDMPDDDADDDTPDAAVARVVAVFTRGGRTLSSLNAATSRAIEVEGLTEDYVDPLARALRAAGADQHYTLAELRGRLQRDLRATYAGPAPEPEIDHAALETAAAEGSAELRTDPNVLDSALSMVRKIGVVGEDATVRAVLLCSVSVLTPRPNHLVITGESSSGKSTIQHAVAKLLPDEMKHMITNFSPRSLVFSTRDFQRVVIFLEEAAALHANGDPEKLSMIRSMMSEGRIVYPITTLSEDGPVTKEYIKDGPVSLITCNVSDVIDHETNNRVMAVGVDGGPDQTRHVLAAAGRRAAGHEVQPDHAALDAWRAFFRWLRYQPTRCVIPFAEILPRHINVAQTRTRRDFEQILAMVRASAVMHQNHRELDAEGRIVATLVDYQHAYASLAAPIEIASERQPDAQVMRLVDHVREKIAAENPASTGKGKGFKPRPSALSVAGTEVGDTYLVSVRQLAADLHMSKSVVGRVVHKACAEGFMINYHQGSTRPLRLEVVSDAVPETRTGVLPTPDRLAELVREAGL